MNKQNLTSISDITLTNYNSINDSINGAINYQPHLRIGNLTLTQDEYETCMRHLLEITKKANPEEFI